MVRKKLIELEEHHLIPQALVIRGGEVGNYISQTLKTRGCQVLQEESTDVLAGKFDYIIQFGNFESSLPLVNNHLLTTGKFLFVETYEENVTETKGMKILRVGDPSVWNISELSERILKTAFSAKSTQYINAVKKPFPYPGGPARKMTQIGQRTPPSNEDLPVGKENISQSEEIREIPQIKEKFRMVEKRRSFPWKFIMVVFAVFIASVCVLAVFSYFYFLKIEKTYDNFKNHLAAGNWIGVSDDLKEARKEIIFVKGIHDGFLQIFFPLQSLEFFQNTATFLDTNETLFTSGLDLMAFSKRLGDNSTDLTGNINYDNIGTLKKKINVFRESIVSSKKSVEVSPLPYFPKESFIVFLSQAYDKLTAVNDMLPIVEKIFYPAQDKTYLILFQNNMELRPTGGFIGSYALLNIGNGKMKGFSVSDVYTADGQLKGHVDPPDPIRKYLAQPHFFLRDSNYDPDFVVSGEKAIWFLQKELGIDVDGVIGINLFLVEKILSVTGPVRLVDFGNEEIASANFFAKAQYYSEGNFFPGSTSKKDFITAMANSLLNKIMSGKENLLIEILPVVKKSLEEKNIIVYSREDSLQNIIEEKGYAGRMVNVKCVDSRDSIGNPVNTASCYSDYLSVIEANFGVNKANYFVSKSTIVEKIISSDGQVTTLLTLSYKNDSNNLTPPALAYVNYLRIIVPIGSRLNNITVNNIPLSPADIDNDAYGSDKNSYGFLMKIAPENKGVVKANFTLGSKIPAGNNIYELMYQKQSGEKLSPLVLSVTYPQQQKYLPVNFKSSTIREREIYYSTDTSVDRVFTLKKDN